MYNSKTSNALIIQTFRSRIISTPFIPSSYLRRGFFFFIFLITRNNNSHPTPDLNRYEHGLRLEFHDLGTQCAQCGKQIRIDLDISRTIYYTRDHTQKQKKKNAHMASTKNIIMYRYLPNVLFAYFPEAIYYNIPCVPK